MPSATSSSALATAPSTVEILFDIVSPNAYLAWYPLREIAARYGANVQVTPVFLAGMHRVTGNAPPMIRDKDVSGKVEYSVLEMQRFIAKHGYDKYRMHPQFPFNSVALQRMLLAVDDEDRVRLVEALLPAIWEQSVLLDDQEALQKLLVDAGFDPATLMAATQDPSIKQKLVELTQDAVDRGAFGIPTVFVDGEMYFGKERLGQIEEQLAGSG